MFQEVKLMVTGADPGVVLWVRTNHPSSSKILVYFVHTDTVFPDNYYRCCGISNRAEVSYCEITFPMVYVYSLLSKTLNTEVEEWASESSRTVL